MFRFTIRDLLWLMVVVGLACGWWVDHRWAKIARSRYVERYRRQWNERESDWNEAHQWWREAKKEWKSLALTQELLPAMGLVGVWGWKPNHHQRLLTELESINWNGRKVYLIPDSDIASKEGVQAAFAWLAKHLKDRGAVVKLVRLPDAADGSKFGADDFLAHHREHGKGELRKLLDGAEDPPPVGDERSGCHGLLILKGILQHKYAVSNGYLASLDWYLLSLPACRDLSVLTSFAAA